jgi:hypothetical protein
VTSPPSIDEVTQAASYVQVLQRPNLIQLTYLMRLGPDTPMNSFEKPLWGPSFIDRPEAQEKIRAVEQQ